jgi:ligand-binding sensor domain-containing protein
MHSISPDTLWFRAVAMTVFLASVAGKVSAQPDIRFDPFDWVVYRQIGSITSITEGFSYAYLGTELGGIIRYDIYGNRFPEPITPAQGLSSHQVKAVYFDRYTGYLWVATPTTLDYSYNREGEWHHVPLKDLSLPKGSSLRRLGSSKDYLWGYTGTMYYKLDHVTGILLGVMLNPDEKNIAWSSAPFDEGWRTSDFLNTYSVMDGWLLNLDEMVSPQGKQVRITTVYEGQFGDLWVGTDDGTLFHGETQMRSLYPLVVGLGNNDVQSILGGQYFWLVGRQGRDTRGITQVDLRRDIYTIFDFNLTPNARAQSLYTIEKVGDEMWFGGVGQIIVYDLKHDFWRTYDETRGIPNGNILSLSPDSQSVWIGSTAGLGRLDRRNKRQFPMPRSGFINNLFIYDLKVIEGTVWVGTEYMLYLIDPYRQVIRTFKNFGDPQAIRDRLDTFSGFTAIERIGEEVYVATFQGILVYNLTSRRWSLAVDPSIYGGQAVYSLQKDGDVLFIAQGKGFTRYELDSGQSRAYEYPFIGRVNDMYISNEILWLGTNQGLVKFHWKKDR